jgi:hypothetical protein
LRSMHEWKPSLIRRLGEYVEAFGEKT